jgi:ATP-dependent RNA helicase DeaD
MSQPQRDRALRQYRNGEVAVLVATDVAARGLDVKNIDAVVNYDIPQDPESYVHRIGRTGRADSTGVSYTFVMSDEIGQLKAITRMTNAHVPSVELKTAEAFVSGKAAKSVVKQMPNAPGSFERYLKEPHRGQSGNGRSSSRRRSGAR